LQGNYSLRSSLCYPNHESDVVSRASPRAPAGFICELIYYANYFSECAPRKSEPLARLACSFRVGARISFSSSERFPRSPPRFVPLAVVASPFRPLLLLVLFLASLACLLRIEGDEHAKRARPAQKGSRSIDRSARSRLQLRSCLLALFSRPSLPLVVVTRALNGDDPYNRHRCRNSRTGLFAPLPPSHPSVCFAAGSISVSGSIGLIRFYLPICKRARFSFFLRAERKRRDRIRQRMSSCFIYESSPSFVRFNQGEFLYHFYTWERHAVIKSVSI